MVRADLVVLSTRVVTPEGTAPAAVAISGGVITAIHDHGAAPDSARRVDVGDAVLLPGIVDTHVHVNEPGRTEWEGLEPGPRPGWRVACSPSWRRRLTTVRVDR